MTRAISICAEPLCPNSATRNGRCPKHQNPKTRPGSTRRWRRTRAAIISRDQGICHICGQPGADSVDHLIPVAKGGTDNPANLRAAHLKCNIQLGGRPLGVESDRLGTHPASKTGVIEGAYIR